MERLSPEVRKQDQKELSPNTQETWVSNKGKQICGIACIPEDGRESYPLVIFAHELGENHKTGIPYAERLAADGYAVYTFDFCGRSADSTENRSDGSSADMSVMTEVSDLESVLAAAGTWKFADPEKVAVLGGSQGEFASAAAAAGKPEEIKVLIMPS
ncbi:MAG: alpha/beta hydrolase family protein [Bulleidia sp.]